MAPVTGIPWYFQHSGLNLDNQDVHPQSRFADSTQNFLQAFDLPDPYYSVERGRSERHRGLVHEPRIGSLEDCPDYKPRISSRDLYHPYIRILKKPHRKRMPAVKYEPDASKLQQRCSWEGGDPDAIKLISKVFAEGVKLSALTRQKTAEEVACRVFGEGPGQVYLGFLETMQMGQGGGEDGELRYYCRLCPDFAKAASWKHERDVLRHLRKHHFGLASECEQWCVNPYTYIS